MTRGFAMQTAGRLMLWALLLTAAVSVSTPDNARAEGMGDVLSDAFYGGLAGALVGAAVLAFTDEPGDHLDYMLTGAGIGVIAGTIYGVAKVTRHAMVDVDRGRVAWHVPRIDPAVGLGADGTTEVSVSAALVRVRF